jgi:hypothetical protein
MDTRPLLVTVTALVTVVAAVPVLAVGWFLTAVSACCGSSEEQNDTPLLLGTVVAGCLVLAGCRLFVGRTRPSLLVALTGLPTVVCVAAVPWSYDAASAAVLTGLGWLVFCLVLSRRRVRGWLRRSG